MALQTGTAVLAGGADGNIYYQPLITSAIKPAASSTSASSTTASSSSPSYSTLSGHSDSITALAVSSTSSLLASASTDGSIRLWDLHTLHCIRTLNKSSRPPYTYLSFAHPTPAPLAGVDWTTLRGTRTREQSSTLTVAAGQRGSRGDTIASRARGEVEAEWRSVRDDGELSEMRSALVDERRRREAVEAELEQWKEVNRMMYRKVAAKLLDEVKQKESKDQTADEQPIQEQVKESEERQLEEEGDEVQVVGEAMHDADESMEDAAEDESGGHVITVE